MNKDYLNHDGPTNVISFAMQEGEFSHISPFLLGDVIISADTAEKEATMGGISFRQRLIELLIHGILHLVGYDHEHDEAEALVMEAKSEALLKLVRDSVPRCGVRLSCQ